MRKDRILEAVRKLAPLGSARGVSAAEVSRFVGVRRQNASADLNELWRQGLLRKSKGRPVLFWAADPEETLADSLRAVKVANGSRSQPSLPMRGFEDLVGANGSLREAVEQAKAAMLYPPRGLPTLIVGPTGVGKTCFAEAMYRYAVTSGRLNTSSPFVVFNCADYASNPQLLLSQLFGHVKGAFTGANEENQGLVAKAHGGVLFLDEVHRLPPAGQEMLFLLMDKGFYRMLGDTTTLKQAYVTLIAATSEDPRSVLLATFLRRFPVVIHLPDLGARPLAERLALVEFFLRTEATRIGRPLAVSPLALAALLCFPAVGNVGELRSAVLLGCARGYLDYVASQRSSEVVPIYITHLSPEIQAAYLSPNSLTREIEKLVGFEERVYFPEQESCLSNLGQHNLMPGMYDELRRRMNNYLNSGLDEKEIRLLIRTDLDYYVHRLLGRKNEGQVVSPDLLNAVGEFVHDVGKTLGESYEQETVKAIALHLACPHTPPHDSAIDEVEAVVTRYPQEYAAVRRLCGSLEVVLGRTLTAGDIAFLTLVLASRRQPESANDLAVVVIAYGEHTASSMAEVANRVLRTRRVLAVDIPLGQDLQETVNTTVRLIREAGRVKGAVVLVDMGFLVGIGPVLEQALGVPVQVLPLATTPAVIEAARVSSIPGPDLSRVVEAVKETYRLRAEMPLPEDKSIIITTCLTGKSTARKLAAFLLEAIPAPLRDNVSVRSVDLEPRGELPGLLLQGWDGKIIAAAGTVDPHLPGVPFIGLEEILFGNGVEQLKALLEQQRPAEREENRVTRDQAVALAKRFVTENIGTIDGEKASQAALHLLTRLESLLGRPVTPGQVARWVIHFAFSIERLLNGGPLVTCPELPYLKKHHSLLLETIRQVIFLFEDEWGIAFPDDEIGFLAMIVLSS